MPDERPSLPVPRNLDRGALERVIARAAELQAKSSDTPESLTAEQVLEVGKEVGLSGEHLRQALAEEQTRVSVPEEDGQMARLFGPGTASAIRTVPGTPASVLQALEHWMQKEECLQVKRRWTDRVTWEEARDFVGHFKRRLNIGGRGYSLTKANEVAATVVAVDEERTLVRLDANVEGDRKTRVRVGASTAATGVAAGAATIGLGSIVIASSAMFLPIIVAAGMIFGGAAAGYRYAKGHRDVVMRVQLALEQILDRLEHGEMKKPVPSLLDTLAAGRLPDGLFRKP